MKITHILFLATYLLSCSESKYVKPRYDAYCEACEVVSPQKNLEWLKIKITQAETIFEDSKKISFWYIYMTHFKGRDVFLFHHSSVVTFDDMYDCQGNIIELTIEERDEVANNKANWICIYDFSGQNL